MKSWLYQIQNRFANLAYEMLNANTTDIINSVTKKVSENTMNVS